VSFEKRSLIIQAISEAVKHNAAYTGYLESVLKNWNTLGLFTMEKLKAHKKREQQVDRCNAEAY
jgi:DnaD/phage-associated family protein